MNKAKVLLLTTVASALFAGCAVKNGPQTVETKKEETVVSTSVAICEILDALEVDSVVGVPQTVSTLPERYKEATNIGSPMSPDLEVIKTLQPSVVISPSSLEGELKKGYEAAGIPTYFANLSSVDGMYESIRELGSRFGVEEKAATLVNDYETYKQGLAKKYESVQKKKVLILMGLPGSYVVATEHSYVGNLVKLAGGENVYEGESNEEFIQVNTEDMLKKAPDIILTTAHAMPEQVKSMFKEEFKTNDIWKHFEAVKNEQVYMTQSSAFGMSANLRYQQAVEELEGYLYATN